MVNELKKLPAAFRKILGVCSRQAEARGLKIYLVGGVVRDLLLGKAVFDLDIVVEGQAADFAASLAKHWGCPFRRHHAFGTAAVYWDGYKIDFATARSEYYSHWGVLPKVTPAGLRQDLLRRDFTINAMAISLNKHDYGHLVDFYGGSSDLARGLIRVLHKKSFLDDPTRILRAVRFARRFSFKLEKQTAQWLKHALDLDALSFVHSHRLGDELVLILKEARPYHYIKQLYALTKFSFIDRRMKIGKKDFNLFMRIERAVSWHSKNFKPQKSEGWLIYLGGILINSPREEILSFFHKFSLRKEDMIKVLAMKENLSKVKRLNAKVKPHTVYDLLNPLSLETILFFYADYPPAKIRKNIELFLRQLRHIRLKVKGDDLKKLGIPPADLYRRLLKRLLYVKIDKGLTTKCREIKAAAVIYQRLLRG